jgi:23S rRNA (guanine2445-N2)-methyltransferase / 23S rRNA (guanine2069-N7)-methyltransferase
MVDLARCHVDRAGLVERVDIGQADARRHLPPSGVPDLIVANLPYGVRLGDKPATISLYQDFGAHLRESAPQAHKALLTLADGRGRALGLRARKRYALTNGPLDCELLLFAPEAPSATLEGRLPPPVELGDGPAMVANRLSKNLRHLRRRLRREQISCFRLYDADLPEYAAAVDVYDGHAVVQEYQAPAAIPEATARQRLGYLVRAVRHVLELPRQRVIVKTRRRQRAGDQYQSRNEQDAPLVVTESGLQFEVRLREYLDTGLYLDHRLVRAWVAEHVQETDFLNLFCYTGTASVYAAAGGARSTTSVDLSANYLAWAARNLELNGFTGPRHRLIQADVMSWLANERHRYGLIYVDPPTFSNSKRADDFDIQRQHVALLSLCGERLAPGGTILFSNHFRRFRLDDAALAGRFRIDRPGPALLPFDFARDPRIHHVFVLRSHPAAN